jgi:hypothetical protein
LRVCSCGRKKENRGPKTRQLTTVVGEVAFTRRYWKCTCGEPGAYAADPLLGVQGERSTKTVQRHCCKLAAEMSFAGVSETVHDMLGVALCPETVRKTVEHHGQRMARFQADAHQSQQSDQAFRDAAGEVEIAIDAGKVNTREEGWKDLKIAVISKRPTGPGRTASKWKSQGLPLPTMVLAFAMIAPAKEFRKQLRPRLRRLGVTAMASVHVLADGASWIWKAAGRTLTGCIETLDVFHACQHISKCADRIFGEETAEARVAYRQGRSLLIEKGWQGICAWVGALLSVPEAEGMDDKERERRRPATERLIGYFSKHLTRLNYAERLRSGRAIGSGQVEGKAKTLGLRMKRRAARWRKRNVRAVASLICVRHSPHEWAAYWAMAA